MEKIIKVLDLFCGCGGFSKGFEMSGYTKGIGIDFQKTVKETFEYNHPDYEFILSDIKELNPEDFKDCEIVIGSPPCQNFSLANVKGDPNKGMELVNVFRHWIDVIKPKKWIMENVDQLIKYLPVYKYPEINVLNSSYYGVPQNRKRLFSGDYYPPNHTVDEPVTVWEAIGDLIFLDIGETDKVENHDCFNNMKDFNFESSNRVIELDKPAPTITTKYRCSGKLQLYNHDPVKWRDIEEQTNKKYMKIHKAVDLRKPSHTIIAGIYKDGEKHPAIGRIEIPKKLKILNAKSFNNKGNKPWNDIDRPNQTITTVPSKIFDDEDKIYRRLSVREVARLQSFPDDFIFYGSLSAQYKMIGNAVPPLMAKALAGNIFKEREVEGDGLLV